MGSSTGRRRGPDMSFGKKLRQALGGEDPRAADAQKEAADELRRVQSSSRPGGPAAGGPGPGGPASPSGPGQGPTGPASGPASPPAGGPPTRPNPPPSPSPSGRSAPPPSGPGTAPSSPSAPSEPDPPPPPVGRGPKPSASPAPEGPGIRSGAGAPSAPSGPSGGAAPPPFAAPSSGQELTPDEERQALNEMALEDLGGPAADGGGLQVNPVEAEAMRDRALAQYMQRKEEFDRLRQRQAQRQAQAQPEPQADEPTPAPQARRQAAPRSQSRTQARTRTEDAEPIQPEGGSVEDKLGDIPGLGPAKIRALLKEFTSFEELQQAGEEDLVQVTGIGQQLAREIVRNIR